MGVVSCHGNPDLVLIDNAMNTSRCVWMLDDHMVTFNNEAYPNGCYFQQDNSARYRASVTNEFLRCSLLMLITRNPLFNERSYLICDQCMLVFILREMEKCVGRYRFFVTLRVSGMACPASLLSIVLCVNNHNWKWDLFLEIWVSNISQEYYLNLRK